MESAEKEKIYACEAKREFIDNIIKEREWKWTLKSVADVIGDRSN